jgi:hypothetical protein
MSEIVMRHGLCIGIQDSEFVIEVYGHAVRTFFYRLPSTQENNDEDQHKSDR